MNSGLVRNLVWMTAIIAAGVGLYVSHALTLKHAGVSGAPDSLLERACSASEAASCEKVIKSEWGVLFEDKNNKSKAGIPTALLGTVFFAATLSWLVIIGPVDARRWWAHVVFIVGATMGLLGSVFFEYIMWTKLDAICPLCIVTHVSTLIIFVAAVVLWPRESTDRAQTPKEPRASTRADIEGEAAPVTESEKASPTTALFSDPPPASATMSEPWPSGHMLIVAPIVAVVVIVAAYVHTKSAQSENLAKQYKLGYEKMTDRYNVWQHDLTDWQIAPEVELPIEGRPTRGPADAATTVVLFSDFECPVCRNFEEWAGKTLAALGEKHGGVRFVFNNWPICQACNEHAIKNIHPRACDAAYAAEAAFMVGGNDAFWKMHDLLFEKQAEWTKGDADLLIGYAREIGLDESAFAKVFEGAEARRRVSQQIAAGRDVGKGKIDESRRELYHVNSTPAIFVNNKRLSKWRQAETWNSIMRYMNMVKAAQQKQAAASQPAGGN